MKESPEKRVWLNRLIIAAIFLSIALCGVVLFELKTSRIQAYIFSRLSADCTFDTIKADSSAIRFPQDGPYDERLGYSEAPMFIKRLQKNGYSIEAKTHLSPRMKAVFEKGFTMPYGEKQQTGMRVMDDGGRLIYKADYPNPVYNRFEDIPPLIVKTFLCIEDRSLLDTVNRYRNPAVDWTRLAFAIISLGASKLGIVNSVPGASTLATQIEKYRHSPDGITESFGEKFQQMVSASLRAYRLGENTGETRKDIILQYVNTAPLGAFPGYGEVNGLGEGLKIWYGARFDSLNDAFTKKETPLDVKAQYFRMTLGLIIAHRRPEFYFVYDKNALDAKTDEYLKILRRQLVIGDDLYRASLKSRLSFQNICPATSFQQSSHLLKPANSILDPLIHTLGLHSIYELNRLDCTVESTLDSAATADVITLFKALKERPDFLDSLGLRRERMLDQGDPADVIYSMNLFENMGNYNAIRIQADSYDAPLDFNRGIKLDLGSTAKLRTLITYLEIIEFLHGQLSLLSRDSLQKFEASDSLSAWAKRYTMAGSDTSLDSMLEAGLNRQYSANPRSSFFTGGGLHYFENFDKKDNSRTMSVREGFKFSVNLVFVRLIRDIVDYYIALIPNASAIEKNTVTGSLHAEYLTRFIGYEGGVFLSKFYLQLKKIPPSAMADTLVAEMRSSPSRLSAIFCTMEINPTPQGLKNFFTKHGIIDTSEKNIEELIMRCKGLSLSDRGYLAKIHPLKLWAAAYLAGHPFAKLAELKSASLPVLPDVYQWLYSQKRSDFQKSRIKIVLEMDAFERISQSWKNQGYPFAQIVPSYASALGASADRPMALAQLAGIIQNMGIKCPDAQIARIRFGENTPYETTLRFDTMQCKRILSVQIARAVRSCMIDVVENGTAIRANKAFNGSIVVGGKTGTGDHRLRFFNRSGMQTGEKFVERSATFLFLIGDRFFGTITVAVIGPKAGTYDFTSSYPVQLFVTLAPKLVSIINRK